MTDAVNQTATQEEAPQLNVADLQTMLAVIDLASQRGTFKAAELTAVGKLHDRITAFVGQFAESVQQDADPAEQTGAAQ